MFIIIDLMIPLFKDSGELLTTIKQEDIPTQSIEEAKRYIL
jgi:hypothetical protein